MKAFLLAAGVGHRLRPLTDTISKCLVPIGDVPLLEIWLRLLARHGVSEVLVNLHHRHEQVRGFLDARKSAPAAQGVYEPRLLGSAGTVLANRDFVAGEESFLIAYADNLTEIDLGRMMAFHARHDAPLTLGVAPTDRPSEKGTVLVDERGRVIAFEEKPARPRSNLANVGVYVARQTLFDYYPPDAGGGAVDFGLDVLPRMVPDVMAYRVDELLIDIGTPASYAQAQTLWAARDAAARA